MRPSIVGPSSNGSDSTQTQLLYAVDLPVNVFSLLSLYGQYRHTDSREAERKRAKKQGPQDNKKKKRRKKENTSRCGDGTSWNRLWFSLEPVHPDEAECLFFSHKLGRLHLGAFPVARR